MNLNNYILKMDLHACTDILAVDRLQTKFIDSLDVKTYERLHVKLAVPIKLALDTRVDIAMYQACMNILESYGI